MGVYKRMAIVLLGLVLFMIPHSVNASDNIVYVSDGGSDSNIGNRDDNALKTLEAAYKKLGGDGTVVVCGELTVDKFFPLSDKTVTVTSVYGGVDYRQNGAQLSFSSDFALRGDTVFKDIVFYQKGGNYVISCFGNDVTFGEGITCRKLGGADPTIVGGMNITSNTVSYSSACFYDYTIRVDSGQWSNIIGSNRRTASEQVIGETGNVKVIINGGTFSASGGANVTDAGVIAVGSCASQNGDYYLEINDGRFACSIFGIAYVGGNKTETLAHYNGNVSVKINGGYFNGSAIDAVQNAASSYIDGNYLLEINGGNFTDKLKSLSAYRVRGDAIQSVPSALRDKLDSFGNTIYLSSTGHDGNDGLSVDTPVKTISAALKLINTEKANVIVVSGKIGVPSDTVFPEYTGTLFVTGCFGNSASADPELVLNGNLSLGGNTVFESIKVTGGKRGAILACGNDITIGNNVSSDGVSIDGGSGGPHTVRVCSGDWSSVLAGASWSAVGVVLEGGTVEKVIGTRNSSGDVHIEVCGGTVLDGIVGTEGLLEGDLGIVIKSGKISGNVSAAAKNGTVKGNYGLWIFGGDIAGASVFENKNTEGALLVQNTVVDKGRLTGFSSVENTVFVADGGTGSGKTFLDPVDSIVRAVAMLPNGGTVVICGDYTIDGFDVIPEHSGKLLITSCFGGVDYRFVNGAELIFGGELSFGGETELNDICVTTVGESHIYCNAKKTVFGQGIECTADLGVLLTAKYPVIWGGYKLYEVNSGARKATNLTVQSGTWGGIRAGNRRVTANSETLMVTTGTNVITILGGTFKGYISCIGMNNHKGNVELNISDGVFDCSIFAVCAPDIHEKETAILNGDVNINITGGSFRGGIAVAADKAKTKYKGDFLVSIENADLTRVSEITGTEGIDGDGNSQINIKGIDIHSEINDTVEFSNPVVDYGPDPSVYYRDGWYYYLRCGTIGSDWALTIAKAANLCDIGAAAETVVWRASKGCGDELDSIWSPYLNYIDGKWYIHGPCHVRGTESMRYPYVWIGNSDDPLDGFTLHGTMDNYDTKVYSWLNTNPIYWGGKLYMFSSGFFRSTDKGDNRHWEKLFVAEANDPISFKTDMKVISAPSMSWEISYGGTVSIMEGGVPIVSPNGTLYLTYAANQTLTDDYCTGVLRFKGTQADDLSNAALWEKLKDPLHRYTYGENVYSPGAMTFTYDFEGNLIGVYHVKHFSAATYMGRSTYIQPVRWENDTPVMDKAPEIGELQYMKANPMPLNNRIAGFVTVISDSEKTNDTDMTTGDSSLVTDTPDVSNGVNADLLGIIIGGLIIATTLTVCLIIKKKRSNFESENR